MVEHFLACEALGSPPKGRKERRGYQDGTTGFKAVATKLMTWV